MALGDVIARLAVELGLNTAAFEKGASSAAKSTDQLGDRMEKMGHRVGSTLKVIAGVGAAIAGSAIVSQVRDMAMAGLEHASALGEQAQQLGVTTSELQRFRYMATQVGIDQEVMDKGLAKLSLTLGDLKNGAKAPVEAMQRLGFTTEETAKIAGMTAGQAFPLLADAFAKLKSPTEQASIAADIFGSKMGGKFLTLLAGGSQQINDLADAYKKLNIELSPEQIAKADEAMDKMAALQQAVSAKQAQVAVDNADALIKGTEAWELFKIRALDALGNTSTAIDNFDTKAKNFSTWIEDFDRRMGIPSPTEFSASIGRHFEESFKRVTDFFKGLYNFTINAPAWIRNMVASIGSEMGSRLSGILDKAKSKFGDVKDAAFDMWDKVTRRSYVPDMIDDIAREFGRLDAVMVAKTDEATKKTKTTFDRLGYELRGLMDRLFPEAAELAQLNKDLGTLSQAQKSGKLKEGQAEEARRRLYSGVPETPDPGESLFDRTKMEEGLKGLAGALATAAGATEIQTVRIAKSFKDMAQESISALQNLVNSVKSGSWIDILGSAVDLFLTLGGSGMFGKKIQTSINVPKYATGTRFHRGGAAIVGERGPELVNLPRGSSVTPNNKLGGNSTYHFQGNLLTPEFWNQIRMGDVAAADSGANLGIQRMSQRQSRRLA